MNESQQQVEALRQAYGDDEGMRQVLEAFSKYQNSMRTVNVDVIWSRIGRSNTKRSQIVAALKRLQELGFGTYTKGAHQYPSRFGFPRSKGPLWLAGLAEGRDEEDLPDDTSDNQSIDEDDFPTSDDGDVVHKFRLRHEKEIFIALPIDLTSKEGKRLSLWLKSLPFDSDGEEFQ